MSSIILLEFCIVLIEKWNQFFFFFFASEIFPKNCDTRCNLLKSIYLISKTYLRIHITTSSKLEFIFCTKRKNSIGKIFISNQLFQADFRPKIFQKIFRNFVGGGPVTFFPARANALPPSWDVAQKLHLIPCSAPGTTNVVSGLACAARCTFCP